MTDRQEWVCMSDNEVRKEKQETEKDTFQTSEERVRNPPSQEL